jgi:hypothetical protein
MDVSLTERYNANVRLWDGSRLLLCSRDEHLGAGDDCPATRGAELGHLGNPLVEPG